MVPSTSLPPDAASFGPLALGVALSRDIPAYSYWNFQLEQPEPGYIQLAFNIPRGSSIGTLAFVLELETKLDPNVRNNREGP